MNIFIKLMFPKKDSKTLYILAIGFQLSFSIAVPIFVFIFIGMWLDEKFKSAPLWTIAGTILGIIISVYGIYKLLKPLMEDKDKK